MVFHIIIPQTRRHYKRFLLFFCVGTPRFPPESRRVPNDARPAAPGSVRFPGRPGVKADAQALHPAAASAFRTHIRRKQTRYASTSTSTFIETLWPQNQKGPRRGPSALPKKGARRVKPYKAIPCNRRTKSFRQAAPNRLFKTVSVSFISPVCVLFCAITRKICLICRFPDAHRNRRCA